MSVSELFSLCMSRRAWFSDECCYEISFNCMLSINLVKLCPCVTEIVLVQLFFWWYEDMKTEPLRAVSYLNCAAHAGKKEAYLFSLSQTCLKCFIKFEFSILWSSGDSSLFSSFCPLFYENKAILPKHGKGFTFHTDFIFLLRDFFFFAHFLKQRIQKDLIPPMNQKRKPMRLNVSDPKPRMQLCKAGQEHINHQPPQALMTVRKMKW